MNKNIIIFSLLIFLFIFGIMLILKSDIWNLGDFYSMNLAGAIISIFSGIGLLIIFYINGKKSK